MHLLLLLFTALFPLLACAQFPPIEFEPGDRILLYGNSAVERLQEDGTFEATIQIANPDKKLEFRSLAWTGDEVGYRLRPERYANHLKNLLAAWSADIVLIGGFGTTESIAGDPGLPAFKQNLKTYLREINRRHPSADIIFLKPADIAGYGHAIDEVAAVSNVAVLDLAAAQGNPARWAADQLLGSPTNPDDARIAGLAQAVSQKAAIVSTLVRPINAIVYFGVRQRRDEYDTEMPRYHALVRQADAVIHNLASDPKSTFASLPKPSLAPLPARKPQGAEKEGIILPPEQQQATIDVADGYQLNLFASEQQFPHCKNPLQIAFGPRGRLWVVTMPSFPHTVPGEQPKDKILILEDTDHDGTADKQTVFADGLNVPDGIVFYKDGIIISAQPRLLYLADTDGDGHADHQEELLRGIDVTDAHHGGMIAMDPIGHIVFCDGVFHRSQFETPAGVVRGVDATTYRFNPETHHVTSEYQTITPNPWKITFDRWGNLFQMYGDGFVQDSQAVPWSPLGIYHPFKRAIVIAYGKGSGAAVISSPNYPDGYQQGMASATLLGKSFVALSKLDPATGLNLASGRLDIISSDNAAFRPVDMAFGFDGAMYVSDFCSPIVGHAQHPMRDPRWDHDHGRIWRVTHTRKPLVTEWPDVAAADTPTLLKLLEYPQDNVRDLARVRLRNTPSLVATLDRFLTRNPDLPPGLLLEFLWLYESKNQTRPALLTKLLTNSDFHFRAAASRLVRFQADRLSDAFELLSKQATDPHPRVRVEVINALSHLQQSDTKWASLLGKIPSDDSSAVATMLSDASHGTTPAKGPEVPVLDIPKDTQLLHWLSGSGGHLKVDANGRRDLKEAVIKTYITSSENQPAILSLSHKHVRVSLNGVQLLHADTWWSSDWNLPAPLVKGTNEIEIAFTGGGNAQGIAPVYLFDPVGTPLQNTTVPDSSPALTAAAETYTRIHGASGDTLRITAVPAQLAFTPKELHLKPGQKITLVFDNPDLQLHNVVITKPGSTEKVGLLSDQLALDPTAMERHYVPGSDAVIFSTPLVNAHGKIELEFTAPSTPGTYPILCTFPGHWRVMQASLIIE